MTRHAKPRHTALALSIASLCFTWASCAQPLVIKQTPSNEYQRDSGRYRVGSPERLRIEDLTFDKAIPTPASFLGYEIGDQYTRHPDAIAYFKLLAEASDRVNIEEYGRTHADRPLIYMTISSPKNLANLDTILAKNHELTRIRDVSDNEKGITEDRVREIVDENPAIVWLSYNVHGNEPSSTETALLVAHMLAAGTNKEITEVLDKCVIVIDPCLNPDGRERYVNWIRDTLGKGTNPNPDAREHDEPWPGGRVNHYLFDLNRDWVWLTQPESQARIKVYTKFKPQLHIDYHEQGHNNPYFFGAGDEPYNANIPDVSRKWFNRYGQSNAEVFDAEGLMYATRERFDYLYPGYGKVLPCYHGAIGLLCEKGGHSAASLAIEVSDQYTLTLGDRIRHHFLTSINYLQATAEWRHEQLWRFHQFYRDSVRDKTGLRSIAILPDNDPAVMNTLLYICKSHGIDIMRTTSELSDTTQFKRYDTGNNLADPQMSFPEGTWIVRTDQEMGRLIRALFERATYVSDPETYDISGWSIPLTFGLHAYYAETDITALEWSNLEPVTEPFDNRAIILDQTNGNNPVAVIIAAGQNKFADALGAMLNLNVYAKAADEPFTMYGRTYAAGSIIVPAMMNPDHSLHDVARAIAETGASVTVVDRSLPEHGKAFGVNANPEVKMPKILLASGGRVSANSFGQHWHLLDVAHKVPHTVVNIDSLGRVNLDDYTVLVLPSGASLSGGSLDAVKEWVRSGGTVVASGSSGAWANREIAGVDPAESNTGQRERGRNNNQDDEDDDDRDPNVAMTFAERKDQPIASRISGAMLITRVDTTHPLSAGSLPYMGVIKQGSSTVPVAPNGSVIAQFIADGSGSATAVGGLAGPRALKSIGSGAFVSHHRVGSGSVISFSDDVTIRAFHHAGNRLLLNAIVLGPTLNRF
ncbi:MAG: hypothetical protein H6815_05365 [Phycisphaeraceae bacterium]|nr:hypothetical protein [Phycisphaerales bacterium]MCB9859866.1 hypothetical protein [Phycisphaeraceae bacterium]